MTAEEKLLKKSLVTSGIGSSEWNTIQAGLRDRAFFSAKVESARVLSIARKRSAEVAAGKRSASEFRRDVRAQLASEGYKAPEGKEGTLEDLSSRRRLDLIRRQNVESARGYVREVEGRSPGAMAVFPAQELIRIRASKKPRDWSARWKAAGGKVYGGRMIALKGAEVWTNISRFGTPWPPFDFGSNMGVRDVDREECEKLGVLKKGEEAPKRAKIPGFNDKLEAVMPEFNGKDDPIFTKLKDDFGDQVVYKDNRIVWKNDLIKEAFENVKEGDNGRLASLGRVTVDALYKIPEDLRDRYDGKGFTLTKEFSRHVQKHYEEDKDKRNTPIIQGDIDLLPTIWRSPDRVTKGKDGAIILELDLLDGDTICLIVSSRGKSIIPLTF